MHHKETMPAEDRGAGKMRNGKRGGDERRMETARWSAKAMWDVGTTVAPAVTGGIRMRRRWWWFVLFAPLLVACGGSATPNGSSSVTSTANPQATATRTTELTQIATATRAVELTQVAPLVASPSPSPLPVTAVTLSPPSSPTSAPNPPVIGAATATPVSPATGTGSTTTPAAAAANGSVPAGSSHQVVTVNPGDVVRVRSKPSTDADTAVEVAGGSDLLVIEANVPGSDGASRWFHVLFGTKEGYVRGDLVGPPHTAVVATKASGAATGTPRP